LEQWNERWGVRAQFEQFCWQHEHEHWVPLRVGRWQTWETTQVMDVKDQGF
jgi:hypothetical protein